MAIFRNLLVDLRGCLPAVVSAQASEPTCGADRLKWETVRFSAWAYPVGFYLFIVKNPQSLKLIEHSVTNAPEEDMLRPLTSEAEPPPFRAGETSYLFWFRPEIYRKIKRLFAPRLWQEIVNFSFRS
jgi:hypothetical protein